MARHGFALPDLWFLPAGDKIDLIAAGDVYLRFARLTFVNSAAESLPLKSYVSGCICLFERLSTASRQQAFAIAIFMIFGSAYLARVPKRRLTVAWSDRSACRRMKSIPTSIDN